jgi:hypothetical protein
MVSRRLDFVLAESVRIASHPPLGGSLWQFLAFAQNRIFVTETAAGIV